MNSEMGFCLFRVLFSLLKRSILTITKDSHKYPVNQSKLEAQVMFFFPSDWITKWRDYFLKPIVKRDNAVLQ